MRIYTYGIIQSYTKKIELYGGKNTELNRLNFIPTNIFGGELI